MLVVQEVVFTVCTNMRAGVRVVSMRADLRNAVEQQSLPHKDIQGHTRSSRPAPPQTHKVRPEAVRPLSLSKEAKISMMDALPTLPEIKKF
jgi:hypothetical protein